PRVAALADLELPLEGAAAPLHQVQPHRLPVRRPARVVPRVADAAPQRARRRHSDHLPLRLQHRLALGQLPQPPLPPPHLPPRLPPAAPSPAALPAPPPPGPRPPSSRPRPPAVAPPPGPETGRPGAAAAPRRRRRPLAPRGRRRSPGPVTGSPRKPSARAWP